MIINSMEPRVVQPSIKHSGRKEGAKKAVTTKKVKKPVLRIAANFKKTPPGNGGKKSKTPLLDQPLMSNFVIMSAKKQDGGIDRKN